MAENGYHVKWKVLNAKDYGNVPQNRERIYIVGFRNKDDFDAFAFPEPIKLTRSIHDFITNKMKNTTIVLISKVSMIDW